MLPVLFRHKLRLIITEAVTTDIRTEGITTDTTITGTTIGTGVGLSALMGVQVITAIGKRPHGRRDHASEPIATTLYLARRFL
ncbi:MAG: hypothetical protein DME98_16330 [Verrucomicrobia bacterium]|nr:MAG: hypothetical protein DME98_16330 [Verrucomicrobiota bacterium]PYJ36026.1 MAG: hypothetical protein DME88_00120 [Verrucomicrobiota bacterium]